MHCRKKSMQEKESIMVHRCKLKTPSLGITVRHREDCARINLVKVSPVILCCPFNIKASSFCCGLFDPNHWLDSIIHIVSISEISSLYLASVAAQASSIKIRNEIL